MFVAIPLTPVLFFAAVALVAFSFGGTLTIYPSIISDFFGIRNLAKNYGLLYLGFGLGSLFGYAAAFIFGSYNMTFLMMSALIVVAIIASLLVKLPAELTESHRELVRTHKIRTDEEEAAAAVAAYEKASKAFADPLANLKCDLAPDHLQKKAQEQANAHAQAQSQAQAPAEAPAGANATAAAAAPATAAAAVDATAAANATATASASAEPKEQQDDAPAKAQI